MENVKSVAMAAFRCEDPESLEQIGSGLDAQALGTLVALVGCILVPLLLHANISFEAFGIVVGMTLSGISAIWLTRVPGGTGNIRPLNIAAMAISSGAMVVPAAVLRVSPAIHLQVATLTFFTLAALLVFAGECSRLRLLEHHASGIAGRQIASQARTLRRGLYAIFVTIAAGLAPATFGHAKAIESDGWLILAVSVGMLTVAIVGAMLHARASMTLKKDASFARAIRDCLGFVDPRLLPDEPDWDVPDLKRAVI